MKDWFYNLCECVRKCISHARHRNEFFQPISKWRTAAAPRHCTLRCRCLAELRAGAKLESRLHSVQPGRNANTGSAPERFLLLPSRVGLDKEISVLKFSRSSRREREPLIRRHRYGDTVRPFFSSFRRHRNSCYDLVNVIPPDTRVPCMLTRRASF
jgi:hypothetical protein